MQSRDIDVAIIGAGTAGLQAYQAAKKEGSSAVLIESGSYGTTCARVGCMPSKLLIAAAEAAHGVAEADVFGIKVPHWSVDGAAVMARLQHYRDRFVSGVVESTKEIPDSERLRGQARFTGRTMLQVDDHTQVNAKAVVIAAGSTPRIPAPFDQLEQLLYTNENIFDLETLPESLAVIGTGIIALELGQAFHRLGVKVSLFNPYDSVGSFSDPAVQQAAQQIFCERLDVHLKVDFQSVEASQESVKIAWQTSAGESKTAEFAKVLVAAGRIPNLAGLDLEKTGLKLDDKGSPSWNRRTTQCEDAPIFMAGDVSGYQPLLHEAADGGRIAGTNAATYPEIRTQPRRTPLAIAFTSPQMAVVGQSYQDLDLEQIKIGQISYQDQGRAKVINQNQGMARLYAQADSGLLVGAELFTPQAEHLAHLLAWAVQQELSVQEILELPFYHPTLEEGLRSALAELAEQLYDDKAGCRSLLKTIGS
ncbi:MAG: dihydrolipoyl dehydrogenase [Leptolyngbya sp. SIO4C1]|nr:dihydrolipoyl dehydrogenase [Leptolyngbya sp. SIO4C1]